MNNLNFYLNILQTEVEYKPKLNRGKHIKEDGSKREQKILEKINIGKSERNKKNDKALVGLINKREDSNY